jgi:divalent metal cation (Fe/Co/Zn/Cd) transporter
MKSADSPPMELRAVQRVRLLQWITVGWMCVELAVAGVAGVRAHSVALTAFAGDSGIEVLSAMVVLRRFRIGKGAEGTAARINATLLYLLAAYIVCSAAVVLLTRRWEAAPSDVGIVLLLAAAMVMPLLGRAKRRLAAATGSGALKADAAQSSVCGYMSWIALAGLAANAMFHLPWADPAAGLLLLPLVIREAKEAWRGKSCCC